MTFRDRLLRSLDSAQRILDVPGVMVGGSQVPNLLEQDAAATLVVSQDVDLVVPVESHAEVVVALSGIVGYAQSAEEPSVWVPADETRLEINFIGRDAQIHETTSSYVLEDPNLPLLVFGLLGLLRQGDTIRAAGVRVPLPRTAGLLAEKLLTERAGLKGERDLLVASGLLRLCTGADIDEIVDLFGELTPDQQSTLIGSLAMLSLMQPQPGMPDPREGREQVEGLIARLRNP